MDLNYKGVRTSISIATCHCSGGSGPPVPPQDPCIFIGFVIQLFFYQISLNGLFDKIFEHLT